MQTMIMTFAVVSILLATSADNRGATLQTIRDEFRSGRFDAALQQLEPLLQSGGAAPELQQEARELAAAILHERGEEHFRQAQIAESVRDFDREVELQPERAAHHWQRGIAYYYAGEYDKGARQFELHQTVNPQDVENAAWHFLCAVRAENGSLEAARRKLIPVTDDSRVPMAQIQQMFAGNMSPDEVLQIGEQAGGQAKFYADLYVGLYYEALGQADESDRLLQLAAKNSAAKGNYMRDVAVTHVALRTEQVLRHAVFFKFKDSSTKEDVNRVVEAFRALPSKIEEIRGFQWGENIGPAGLNGELTHCFLLTFKDEAGRAVYLPHPDHKAFGGIVGPHLEKVFVIDYWGRMQDTGLKKELKHAVFFKFKEETSRDDIRAVEESLARLPSKIDTIKAFEWGTNNSPESHDAGFTHCFMFTFSSEEGLKEYAAHPAHVAAAEALRPKVGEVRVFDFWTSDLAAESTQ